MLDKLRKIDFENLEENALKIVFRDGCVALSVVETRDLPPISPRAEPFAIILRGPAAPLLPQGVYPIEHPVHGRLDLFIVPIARDAAHCRYEAIFN